MELCPCGSNQEYSACCEPVITGERKAETAEALMRSRYSAYAKGAVEHLLNSTAPSHREGLDEKATRSWSESAEWRRFELIDVQQGGPDDDEGVVEFAAYYVERGERKRYHEVARFAKLDDGWFYQDGELPRPKQQVNDTPKPGRNNPCPCGSGKKYKKCCGLAA